MEKITVFGNTAGDFRLRNLYLVRQLFAISPDVPCCGALLISTPRWEATTRLLSLDSKSLGSSPNV
jgi:hypothetical protein